MDEVWYVIPVWILTDGRNGMWYSRWVVAWGIPIEGELRLDE